MLDPSNSMALLLLLNIAFASLALVAGVLGGLWFAYARWNVGAASPAQVEESERHSQRESERIAMATDRLRDLASGIASDVDKHSSRVGEITTGLQSLDTDDIEATGTGLVMAMANIISANGALQERLAKAEDQIAAQARELTLQESEARTDSLTGMANRRAFDEAMSQRHAEATRKNTPLSLLLADIDSFKQLNDSHGHLVGDEVLRVVARRLKETCRSMDLPCRYGGEEFAIILPATDLQEAKRAAERVRQAIESLTIKFDGKQFQVTVSIGVAQLANQEDTPRLVRRCDEALYQSKDAGRNCGHWHDGTDCHPTANQNQKRGESSQGEEPSTQRTLLDSLPNRTTFVNELRRRMAESHRTEQPVSIVLAELKDSHELKQRLGSHALVTALNRVAKAIAGSLREMDLAAQLGENRIGIMLPNSTMESSCTTMERVRLVLKQCPLELEDASVCLSLSTGVAELRTGDCVENLVGRAEAALACQVERSDPSTSASTAR
ncbi:diguanylate cyclase [Aeoliella sp. ICT_H6.2]|uniref:diguanylate cyclase n=1 Tax=Aeoliella straminimaris TaxID=2954799 RepID=A0A9X2JJP0_9BACT|nr:diguanylate cyclase [Aeoliella straminimaris]MCO6046963.1 diguanylate cyclase [Aeoliella straminimaris]